PDQRQKPILAEAMKDVLPAPIIKRPDKTHFNAVYFAGLARNLPYLEETIRNSNADELGLFDKEVLISCMRDVALGYRRIEGKVGLDNSLVIIKWLAQLPQ